MLRHHANLFWVPFFAFLAMIIAWYIWTVSAAYAYSMGDVVHVMGSPKGDLDWNLESLVIFIWQLVSIIWFYAIVQAIVLFIVTAYYTRAEDGQWSSYSYILQDLYIFIKINQNLEIIGTFLSIVILYKKSSALILSSNT